eukprot:SAG22_NODE_1605_length_4014_cov_1.785696_3_plen_451_part_01
MLAATLGKRARMLAPTAVSDNETAYALGMELQSEQAGLPGQRVVLLVSKLRVPQTFAVGGFAAGWHGAVVEGVGSEPGFVPPSAVVVSGDLKLGPLGVAVLWETASAQTSLKTDGSTSTINKISPPTKHKTDDERAGGAVSVKTVELPIPQVDYEPLLRKGFFGMPTLNLSEVKYNRTVVKVHKAVVMESDHVKVVLLPAMGRVYRIVDKNSGHNLLWRNDIAWPGGANNKLGWWLWIGGVEYTLPGEEHGYTWALRWDWQVMPGGSSRSVTASVREPSTGLVEQLIWTLSPSSAALRTDVSVHNPAQHTASLAHWVNVPFVPGGTNELSDNTEILLPTPSVNVSARWRSDLGPSPQAWPASPLRFLKGWAKGMGDIMAAGLTEGFHGVYNHDMQEGAVRIVNSTALQPEVDTWTYGFHPKRGEVPMGSGKPSNGYAEMWGGNARCNTLGP